MSFRIRNFLFVFFLLTSLLYSQSILVKSLREEANKKFNDGNYKDALEDFEKLIYDNENTSNEITNDFNNAINCFRNLNRVHEIDSFREKVIEKHSTNWRLLVKIAETYMYGDNYGYVIGNEFSRGYSVGKGKWVNVFERDRVEALRLMEKALNLNPSGTPYELSAFYKSFANIVQNNRTGNMSWQLRVLTDLNVMPDYNDSYYGRRGTNGAPVDESGNPYFYNLPKYYNDAQNDGERWRWLLNKMVEVNSEEKAYVQYIFADFLSQQFGVHTMQSYNYYNEGDDGNESETSQIFSLSSLKENETIARLSSGIKRFELMDEFNYIKIFQIIAKENPKNNYALSAMLRLATIFTNRRQYNKAANYWREIIQNFGSKKHYENSLNQIIKAWGTFEPHMNFTPNEEASISYRFRNANSVSFEAFQIDVKKLLEDVKTYIKGNPGHINWEKINIQDIGRRLVYGNETKYVGNKIHAWEQKLEPLDGHFDKKIHIKTPLKNPGAYLLTATIDGGNVSRIIVWINDSVIIKKPLNNDTLFFLADAKTGAPIKNAELEFFGYKQERVKEENILAKVMFRKYNTITNESIYKTDNNGICIPPKENINSKFNWMIIANDSAGHFAYLGFTGIWNSNYYDYEYNEVKPYLITDRPVYRPLQKVNFKFFLRHAKYDVEDKSVFANQNFTIEIFNPRNEKIFEKEIRSDEYGGISGSYDLPKNATLGNYYINIHNYNGGNTFRVEEYKKPEFEVTIESPKEPVMLGEKISCKIKANYYFGAPVMNAKVKYTVQRTSYNKNWYPYGVWDWLYSPGYWWFAYDYFWYPGFYEWGIKRPHCFWLPLRNDPPELIAENEVEIGKDGTVSFEIDTLLAKTFHGKDDHEYSITAEVVDESRRTITGSGKVIVARKPFKVYTWVDRGYYKTGDSIHANFLAQTLDNNFVEGKGVLTLFKINYKNGEAVEKVIEKWNLDTDERGASNIQIKAAKEGQYRLSYKVIDKKNHEIEGGYVFQVAGQTINDGIFRFNDIEIIPEKKEYSFGEKAKIIINTNQQNSTVLLFLRPANGIYLLPKVLSLNGQSSIQEIEITKKDMPNFFIEALTISKGQIFTEIREIIVPPEKRILNIEILPSKKEFKPGEKGKVKFKVTDFFGNPFKGTLVATMYDKALEYISGGGNVPEIKAFFWKWRRQHNPNTETNIGRYFYNLLKKHEDSMAILGVFGSIISSTSEGWSEISSGIDSKGGFATQRTKMKAVGMCEKMDFDGLSDAAAPCMEAEADSSSSISEETKKVEPIIRTKFADSAFWKDDIVTDDKGLFEVEINMPENITGWKMKVWGVSHGTKVGEAETILTTKKNLMLRLQAPRFFVEKDEVVISANIHNYLSTDKEVTAILEVEGDVLSILNEKEKKILLEAGGEKRVDFRVKVLKEGEAIVRIKALTDEESDAMQMTFPSYIHGIQKMVSFSKVIRSEQTESSITFNIPEERKAEETSFEVRYSPSLAGAMVAALPYLADYPYGCTEQTLNRFLPAVITRKVLTDAGINLSDIKDMHTNLNSQEIGDDDERMKQWKRWKRNPVFDENELDDMINAGIIRLYTMQLSDGGWGWFSGYGEYSSPHTTALIVHGLLIAKEYGVNVESSAISRGINWLKDYQKNQIKMLDNYKSEKEPYKSTSDNLDALIFMILTEANHYSKEMDDYLFRDKNNLSLYGKSLYGLGLFNERIEERYKAIIKNISQFEVYDDENDSAYLNLSNNNYWWYWYGSEFEAQAYYLKLLSKTNPKSKIASGLVKYIINNRKNSTYWNSTRDTAICIEALAEYMRLSGESKPEINLKIYLNDNFLKKTYIDSSNLFSFDNQLHLKGNELKTGKHILKMEKSEGSPLYYNAYLSYFSLEDFITSAGLEIKVNRKYYKLNEILNNINVASDKGAALSQKTLKYDREEIETGDTLKSGDLIEIEMTVESKNDYEYLVIEDMKPSGCEPVDVRSGYNGNPLNAYVEYRDDRVSFFIRALSRGKHSVSYRTRAEIPGKFSALPAKMFAMYAPELKANSDEMKISIED